MSRRQPLGSPVPALLVVGLLTSTTTPLSAQVVGRVETGMGQPLPGVQVDLWSANERVAVRITDESGGFRLDSAEVRLGRRISFTHIGYQRSVRPLEGVRADPVVILEPLPVPLPGLVVLTAEESCPAPDEPEARWSFRTPEPREDAGGTPGWWATTGPHGSG